MLESEIKKLTAAVEANTAALTGAVAPAAPVAAPPTATAKTDIQAVGAVAAPAAGAAAAALVAPAGAASVAPEPAGQPVVAITKKALTEKFIELASEKGREIAMQLLAEYGIASLPELTDKAKWPVFFAACDAKLAG